MPRKKKVPNGTPAPIVEALITPPVAVQAPEQPPSFRSLKWEMEEEVRVFRDYAVEKYSDFHGHDLRKDLSWYMEQMGIGIASDMERVKREERQRLILENQAAQKLAEETPKLDGQKK